MTRPEQTLTPSGLATLFGTTGAESYDAHDPGDQLALRYHAERGSLQGFPMWLRELEPTGRIGLPVARRLHFGSIYPEGYSYVDWRPTRYGSRA